MIEILSHDTVVSNFLFLLFQYNLSNLEDENPGSKLDCMSLSDNSPKFVRQPTDFSIRNNVRLCKVIPWNKFMICV